MSGLPPRLKIRGQQILYPDGTPALLRGMNVMFELDSEYAFPRADTDDLLFELLPGTNLLRLVMLRWDDRPTRTRSGDGNDCSNSIDSINSSDRSDGDSSDSNDSNDGSDSTNRRDSSCNNSSRENSGGSDSN